MDRQVRDQWLVPHQANIRIIQAVARKLDLPMERVIVTVQDQGNTSQRPCRSHSIWACATVASSAAT